MPIIYHHTLTTDVSYTKKALPTYPLLPLLGDTKGIANRFCHGRIRSSKNRNQRWQQLEKIPIRIKATIYGGSSDEEDSKRDQVEDSDTDSDTVEDYEDASTKDNSASKPTANPLFFVNIFSKDDVSSVLAV